MIFQKKKEGKIDEYPKDLYLIEQIQPSGGISFRDEKYIQTGGHYECCLHVFEFPEKVYDNWLKELTDIKDTVVTIDISSEDTYEIKKNINRSLKEQHSRRNSATSYEEAYDAEQRAREMKLLFHELSQMKEIVKIADVRIFVSDRELEKLEEKVAKLTKILETAGYRATIFLNESKQEWTSMYVNYSKSQLNPYAIYGQPVQSRTLAAGNPFHFSSLEDPYGSYLGYTRCGGNILFDEFTKTKSRLHYNSAVIGTMGSGKSTLLKKRDRDRSARGDFVRVFDITGEFSPLTIHDGGKVIKFGEARLNPFEILRAGDNETINFQLHNSKLATNYKFLVPGASEQEVITFGNLVRELYERFDLSPTVENKEVQITGLPPDRYPIFSDLLQVVEDKIQEISSKTYNETSLEVARRNLLTLDNIKNAIQYVIYTFGTFLDGPTTIENILDEPLVCFDISSLKDMKAEIFDMITFNLLSLCWDNCVANGQRMNQMEDAGQIDKRDKVKTLILIDEAHRWVNAKKEHALDLIMTYLREARKYNGGITLASQSIRDPVEMSRVDWYNDWDTKDPAPAIAEAGKSYCVALSLGMNTSVFAVVDSYEIVTINGEVVASALWQGYTMLAGKRYPQLPEAQTPVPPVEDNQVPPAEENKPSYEITDGKGAQWTNTDAEGLTFRSTAAFDKFEAVKVDGQVVDAKYYALSEGSTVVALKPEYLKTLKAGKHIIAIVSEDGEATTEFTVAQAQDVDKEEMKPTGTKPEGNNTTNTNNGSNDTSKTSPKTGDNANIALMVASMALAFLGVTTVTGTYKKRNK